MNASYNISNTGSSLHGNRGKVMGNNTAVYQVIIILPNVGHLRKIYPQ